MSLFDRIIVGAVLGASLSAAYNAREAHRHAHELACHVQDHDLCAYYEKEARHE